MKKKLFSVLTVFAAMTLVACGGGNNSEAKPSSKQPSTTSQRPSSTSQSKSSSSSTPAATEWVDGAKTGLWTKQTRASDNGVAYKAKIADATGWNDDATKMNKKKADAPLNESKWAINGLPAGQYDVEFSARMSYDSHSSRYWYNMAWKGNEDASSNPDKTSESPYRYFIVVYGAAGTDPVNVYTDNANSWGDCGLSGSEFVACQVITGLNLKEGATEISLKHGDIGYSLAFDYVRFIYKGAADATKPYQDVSKLPVDPTAAPQEAAGGEQA